MIEYWSGAKGEYAFPKNVSWEYKTETDLYAFVKEKQVPKCLRISPDGRMWAAVSSDRCIYVFDLRTAKIIKKLDETLHYYHELGKDLK